MEKYKWHTAAGPLPTFTQVGPDGFIYYLSVAEGGSLRRVRFRAGPNIPTAFARYDSVCDPGNRERQFWGEGSFDLYAQLLSYQWDFGDGETSTEVNPIHTYPSNGSFTVRLTVTSGDGISAVAEPLQVVVGRTCAQFKPPELVLTCKQLDQIEVMPWDDISEIEGGQVLNLESAEEEEETYHTSISITSATEFYTLVVRTTTIEADLPVFHTVVHRMENGNMILHNESVFLGKGTGGFNLYSFDLAPGEQDDFYRIEVAATNSSWNTSRQVILLEVERNYNQGLQND